MKKETEKMVGPPDDRRLRFEQYNTLMQELLNKDVSSFKRYPRGIELAMTIRYMATGDSYVSLAFGFRDAAQSIGNFLQEV